MEVKPANLNRHVTAINATLQEVCGSPNPEPLIQEQNLLLSTCGSSTLSRRVVTDLGLSEIALRLPIPNSNQTKYWFALHERWQHKGRHRVAFVDCGLRLYIGSEDEEAHQILRLEWTAPFLNDDGEISYRGKHAAHPHWHVDRSALVGPQDALNALEVLTAPVQAPLGLEDFEPTLVLTEPPPRFVHDCSWLHKIHLPARAQWMNTEWDGSKIPGPHQCEPSSLEELERWWAGALRYFSTELPH